MYGCGCVVVVRLQESFFPTANAESFTKQLTDVWASSPIFESSKVRNRVGGEAVVLALHVCVCVCVSVSVCVCVCACVRARVCACVILPSQPKSTTCFVHCWDYCVQIYRTQFVVKHFAGDIRYETDQCVAAQTMPNVFLHRSLLPLCPHFPFSSPLLSLSLSGFLPPAC